jgi:Restriction endonuclease
MDSLQLSLFDGKVCTKCRRWLLLKCYEKANNVRDGKRAQCRDCHNKQRDPVRTKQLQQEASQRCYAKQKAQAADVGDWKKERQAAYRQWCLDNPEQSRLRGHNYRARLQQAEGRFTTQQWKALCAKYGNICLSCGRQALLTPDHVIPLSRGGSNRIDNIQPLCGNCNSQKGTRSIDYRPDHSSIDDTR